MSDCVHCGGRGWGIRRGYVRRCEFCEEFPHDEFARNIAAPALAAFELRERPVAHASPSGVVVCPWCAHAPTSVGDDVFTQLNTEAVHARAWFEKDSNGAVSLLLGRDTADGEDHGDTFFACPACGRTFEIPDEITMRLRNG